MTTLAIAGWRIRVECSSPGIDEAIAGHYAAFIVPDDDNCDARVTVTLDPSMREGWRPSAPVVRHGDLCEFDVFRGCGRIALDTWEAVLRLAYEDFSISLEQSLRVLWAYLALRQGGLLFHCAGLYVDDGVYLFTGQGGSGKSTVVALSPQAQALNDDLVALRLVAGGWWAYGTPFWNMQTSRREAQLSSGPVARILKLIQDNQVYLAPMSLATASGELVANCPAVNTDPLELPALMGRCRELAQAVKVQRLHFRKSPSFWALLTE